MAHDARTHSAPARQFVLPVLVFGLPEVRRVRRELETLEEFIRSSEIRTPGTQPQLPRLSRVCEALATENKLNLLQPTERKQLLLFIKGVESAAPKVHISFAADPSSAFTAKMVTWVRTNVHRYALLQVGLQPNIAAGCVVRTTNKVFDFSLRERFLKTQNLLIDAFEAEAAKAAQLEAAKAAANPTPAPEGATSAPEYSQSGSAPITPPQPQALPTAAQPAAPAQPTQPLQLQAVPLGQSIQAATRTGPVIVSEPLMKSMIPGAIPVVQQAPPQGVQV